VSLLMLAGCQEQKFKIINVSTECFIPEYTLVNGEVNIDKSKACDDINDCQSLIDYACIDTGMSFIGPIESYHPNIPAGWKGYRSNDKIMCNFSCMPVNITRHYTIECAKFVHAMGNASLNYEIPCTEDRNDCANMAGRYCNYIASGQNESLYGAPFDEKNIFYAVPGSLKTFKINDSTYCDFSCYDGKATYVS